MPPIGETLREARMRQRMDIVHVEERTKIRAKYLRALENEEWGLLPGPTFVRTFLRTYAEAVGLDPHVLVEEYRATHGDAEEVEPQAQPLGSSRDSRRGRGSRSERRRPRAPGPERRRPRAPGPPSPLVLIGAVVVAILAFLIVLGLVGGGDGSSDKASKTTATTRKAPPKRAAKPRKAPAAAARGVTLRIAPSVPTYVCVDSGEGSDRVFEGILEQPRTFKKPGELRANLGKRSVKITANGKEVPVEDNASPLGLRVTRTGAKEITTGTRPCG